MVNALAVEGVSRTRHNRRLATAANRESCDVSLTTVSQLIPQSNCAELHSVDVTDAGWRVLNSGRRRRTRPPDRWGQHTVSQWVVKRNTCGCFQTQLRDRKFTLPPREGRRRAPPSGRDVAACLALQRNGWQSCTCCNLPPRQPLTLVADPPAVGG